MHCLDVYLKEFFFFRLGRHESWMYNESFIKTCFFVGLRRLCYGCFLRFPEGLIYLCGGPTTPHPPILLPLGHLWGIAQLRSEVPRPLWRALTGH